MAINLYRKRKTEALQGKKLPETIRRRETLLSELLADAAEHVQHRYQGHRLGADGKDYRYATLKEALGSRPAGSVTAQEIERALSRLAEARKWKPASFNRHKAFLSLAYRLGVEGGKVESSPVRLVHRRREDNGRIRWLSADEEKALRAAIQTDYPAELPAFDLALHTGMRRSEQFGLTWECVDFERRQITIPRSKHGGIRYIPLDNTALSALLALRTRGNGSGPVMVLAESGHGYQAGHALSTPKEWFMAAVTKAGVADFTWHCLRHTFASRLVMAGVSLRTVQELMGHKTIAMTCRYAHLAPQHQLDAVLRLDGWGREFPTDTKTDTSVFVGSNGRPVEQIQALLQ
jgi:integrase